MRDAAAHPQAGGPGDRPATPRREPGYPARPLGPYEVEVGEAGLPDGALSTRSATVADEAGEFWIADGIEIEVRPVDPARPAIGSIYRDPFDGVEPVKVFLVFDVTELKSTRSSRSATSSSSRAARAGRDIAPARR